MKVNGNAVFCLVGARQGRVYRNNRGIRESICEANSDRCTPIGDNYSAQMPFNLIGGIPITPRRFIPKDPGAIDL